MPDFPEELVMHQPTETACKDCKATTAQVWTWIHTTPIVELCQDCFYKRARPMGGSGPTEAPSWAKPLDKPNARED